MIKAIIIDDEHNNIVTLNSFISKYCLNIEVIATAENVKSGIETININKPDLVFLDIEMPDGSGFDLLESFEKVNFQVIFVTAYDQYAIKAFQYSAIDYLLKPINPEMLVKAVHKINSETKLDEIEKKIKTLLQNKTKTTSLALPTFEGIQVEKIENILYCSSDNNYTIFNFTNNRKLMVSKTLKEYDTLLSENNFLRIHQKHLINLKAVNKYVKGEGGYVIMNDGTSLDVSRRRKNAFIEAITKI